MRQKHADMHDAHAHAHFMVLQRDLGSNHLWFVRIEGDARSCVDDRLDCHSGESAPPLALFSLENFCIRICTGGKKRNETKRNEFSINEIVTTEFSSAVYATYH